MFCLQILTKMRADERARTADIKYACIIAHYAEDDKARAAPGLRRVGEPLQQSPRSCLTQSLPDPLAHKRGEDYNTSYGGHRILQRLDPTTRPPLQRLWPFGFGRPSSPQ